MRDEYPEEAQASHLDNQDSPVFRPDIFEHFSPLPNGRGKRRGNVAKLAEVGAAGAV
jgi:hypothetical protein